MSGSRIDSISITLPKFEHIAPIPTDGRQSRRDTEDARAAIARFLASDEAKDMTDGAIARMFGAWKNTVRRMRARTALRGQSSPNPCYIPQLV